MRQKVIRFYHQMRNLENNEVAATTILTGVHLDCTRRKACLFPAQILERGRRLVTAIS